MSKFSWKKLAGPVLLFLGVWIGLRFALPVLLPFLLGLLVALAAEPVVSFGTGRLKMPRGLAVGIGVSMTLVLLITLISLICSLLVKELGRLAGALPDLEDTAQQGVTTLQNWMTNLAARSPEGVRPILTRSIDSVFENSPSLLNQASGKALKAAGNLVIRLPNGALGFGTMLISGFMISARLPRIKASLNRLTGGKLQSTYLPSLRKVRKVLGHWLVAQLKISAITYIIVALGFVLLRIPYGPIWALGVALVDAMPVLGTGTVLLPWVVVCLLQGNQLRAIGLLLIYATAVISRSILEPRLVGRQLGLDPLVTLLLLYLGFRFWGILGMVATPLLAAAVKCVYQECYLENREK